MHHFYPWVLRVKVEGIWLESWLCHVMFFGEVRYLLYIHWISVKKGICLISLLQHYLGTKHKNTKIVLRNQCTNLVFESKIGFVLSFCFDIEIWLTYSLTLPTWVTVHWVSTPNTLTFPFVPTKSKKQNIPNMKIYSWIWNCNGL